MQMSQRVQSEEGGGGGRGRRWGWGGGVTDGREDGDHGGRYFCHEGFSSLCVCLCHVFKIYLSFYVLIVHVFKKSCMQMCAIVRVYVDSTV